MRVAVLISALLFTGLVFTGTGCSLFGVADGPFTESVWYRGPEEIIWDATLEVIGAEYPLEDVNRADGTFKSEPREFLAPFKNEGRRRTVKGSIEEVDGRYRIRVRVWVETNRELDRPLSSADAKWRGGYSDTEKAKVLLGKIRSILGRTDAVTIVTAPSS